MNSTSLDDLDSRFRPIAEELLQKAQYLGPIRVICTLRGKEEQARAVAVGTSRTMRSKHLPQPPEGKSHAIDICPERLLATKNWSPLDPVWQELGDIGVSLGLVWGGNWKRFIDKPHFEWSPPRVT